tara:strand:+ start:2768 stop:3715 length:948 start_codon:yes stop_codon:yes gene_type:complete
MDVIIKTINKGIKSVNKLSSWAKILILVIIVLMILQRSNTKVFKSLEGFESKTEFKQMEGDEIYDDFYADIYDSLTYLHKKNEYEMWALTSKAKAVNESKVLDIGSGTGHHLDQMRELGITDATGIEKSKDMVKKSKKEYPNAKVTLGDALNNSSFGANTFTHITCFYFTIYYFEDKAQFLSNCYHWLKPGGRLIVHMVDKSSFDPILPMANPLMMLTPQRYAKDRITHSNIVFDSFKYEANFKLQGKDKAEFVEKFKDRKTDHLFRKNKHQMYMEDDDTIAAIAQSKGFIVAEKLDMVKAEYEYNYLYIFQKPA